MWQWDICLGDVVPRVWGPCVGPSQFPLLKGSPSRWPRATGAGPFEGYGRARTASRRPRQCGALVLPRSQPARAASECGGEPAGASGIRVQAVGWKRRRVRGGPRGRGGSRQPCQVGQRGAPSMAPPPPLLGLFRGPTWRSHPGGVARGAAPQEASGRPCQYTGA